MKLDERNPVLERLRDQVLRQLGNYEHGSGHWKALYLLNDRIGAYLKVKGGLRRLRTITASDLSKVREDALSTEDNRALLEQDATLCWFLNLAYGKALYTPLKQGV